MSNLLSKPLSWLRRRWVYPLVSATVAVGLWTSSLPPVQAFSLRDLILHGIQVIQLSNMSDRQEVEIGKRINEQLVNRQIRLYRNREINDYINDIGQEIAAVSDRDDIPYTFQVVKDDSLNAFATMGGFIYIHTGLIEAADNEAQLASVIAHEIAHITNRHAVKQMKEAAIAQGIASAAEIDRSVAVNIGYELALRRPNSREDEREADEDGWRFLGNAGYAQVGMIQFFEKLQGQGSVPTFLSTHPSPENRVARLRQQLDEGAQTGKGLDESAYQARIRPLLR